MLPITLYHINYMVYKQYDFIECKFGAQFSASLAKSKSSLQKHDVFDAAWKVERLEQAWIKISKRHRAGSFQL